MGAMRNAYNILTGKLEAKRSLGRHSHRMSPRVIG